MLTAQAIAALLKEENESNATLTDADLQHAIDTVGAECSVADVRRYL